MTHEEAFLRAIREAPQDPAPRLLYADWLEERGDPRGEFIRVQCSRQARLWTRAWKLLETNWEAWVGPLRALVGPDPSRRGEGWLGRAERAALAKFGGGFMGDLAFDAGAFARGEASRLTVLQRGRVYQAGAHAAALAASPRLTSLYSLQFRDYYDAPLDAKGAAALAASPYLQRLTLLLLGRNNIGDAGAEALARAPWLARLRQLDLTDNGLSVDGLRALIESAYLSRQCTVYLEGNGITADAVDRLARVHGRSPTQFRL